MRICSLLILIVFSLSLFSQNNLGELKAKRAQYLKEIDNAKKLLSEKGNTRKSYLNELIILNSQIESQVNIIENLKNEIELINNDLEKNKMVVSELKNEIENIKKQYARLIIQANRQKRNKYEEFMLIFSSKSFSEAYRRFQVMKEYSSYRKKQGIILIESKNKLDRLIEKNSNILLQKKESYNNLVDEKSKLEKSIDKKKEYVDKLKNEENWLRKEIKDKSRASDDLEKEIEKLIADAIATEKNIGFSNFSNSRGKLSWPVDDGIITGYFGEHNHAVLKGVKVKNNGIDIATAKENIVKCVYEGVISKVIAIPGYNKAVIVRHGKYLTVYANLTNVYVKNGQVVKSNQKIGQIFASSDDKNGILHFEIWEENKKIDPVTWLSK